MLLYWNNISENLENHQKSLNLNKYFSTVKKDPLLINNGWIYLKDFPEQHLIQMMLVGIKLIKHLWKKFRTWIQHGEVANIGYPNR